MWLGACIHALCVAIPAIAAFVWPGHVKSTNCLLSSKAKYNTYTDLAPRVSILSVLIQWYVSQDMTIFVVCDADDSAVSEHSVHVMHSHYI